MSRTAVAATGVVARARVFARDGCRVAAREVRPTRARKGATAAAVVAIGLVSLGLTGAIASTAASAATAGPSALPPCPPGPPPPPGAPPCDPGGTPPNAIRSWDDAALQAIRGSRPGPPVVARVLAMVHTAQYEAWSQYDETAVGTLLGDRFRRPLAERTTENKAAAVSYAAYQVLSDLYPSLRFEFDAILAAQGLDPSIRTTNPVTPAGMGNLAAAVVLQYRHHDGANQLGDLHPGAYSDYTGYVPVNTPTTVNDINRWQPLQTANGSAQGGCLGGDGTLTTQTYVAPHWGNVVPFALDDGAEIAPDHGPALYPSPAFAAQAAELVEISANLTDRQKAIVEYWVDGPASELPPGHWALFAQIVSDRDHHTLDQDAELFFALSNANLDASILAWKVKRQYDSVRPITAIRELYRGVRIQAWGGPGLGTVTINGEDWQPYQQTCFVTPAFPEFVSGHSTFSAASAEVLKSFTGSDSFSHSETVTTLKVEPDTPLAAPVTLHWDTFSEAADEAAISRRYGGIHFADGDLEGRRLGRQVGSRAWDKAQGFFSGAVQPVANYDSEIAEIIAVDNIDFYFNPDLAHAPTALALSAKSVSENTPAGTVVGLFGTSDPDAGDTFTYALVPGPGGFDNFSFAIAGDALVTAGSFDYEQRGSYFIRVRTTDSGGRIFEQSFVIDITNVNESPTMIVKWGQCSSETKAQGWMFVIVDDVDTPVDSLTLSVGTNSNPRLLPPAGLTFGGSDGLRRFFVTASPGRGGSGKVALQLGDGDNVTTVVVNVIVDRTGHATLLGTNASDMMFGFSHTMVKGLDGNDLLCGGASHQLLDGGSGDDSLWGGRGNDRLYGGSGNDALFGLSGRDLLFGGPDPDVFSGGAGDDRAGDFKPDEEGDTQDGTVETVS